VACHRLFCGLDLVGLAQQMRLCRLAGFFLLILTARPEDLVEGGFEWLSGVLSLVFGLRSSL